MNNIDNLLATKLQYRLCRKSIHSLSSIQSIVKECCDVLGTKEPTILFCESITKDFQAFGLRNEKFFIYDSGLMETLYLYNCIVFSGFIESDMDKFFYKLFGEELILRMDIPNAMYFIGKYNNMEFSFDQNEFDNSKIREYLSIQNYFLIGHELTHLTLQEKENSEIPKEYEKFVIAALALFTERAVDTDRNIKEVLSERAGYFLDISPSSIEEYAEMLKYSDKFHHFLEECYCDYMGFKLLIENYENAGQSINAIISALSCLITLESIRNDIRDGIEFIKDGNRIADLAMYFSVLRTQILLCTIEISKLDTVAALNGVHKRSKITDRLIDFIQNLPSKDSFAVLSENDLPQLSKKTMLDVMIKQLYYISISSEF